MKSRRLFYLLSISLLLFVFSGSAPEAGAEEALTESGTERESETEWESETERDTSVWMDYQLKIGKESYQFPMDFETFEAYGWSGGTEGGTMEPYQYARYIFTRENESCSAYLLNPGADPVSLSDCIVAGIVIEEHDWADVKKKISLPGGLVRGRSSSEEIVEAYGEPTSLTEGSLYTIYTYREDDNREVELEIYNKTDLLENIRIENFAEPAGYEKGETVTEMPQHVLDYTRPESLNESLTGREIELDGIAYTLPVPVRALVEDGWEIVEKESDAQIQAQYYGWVTLKKGDAVFTQIVTNSEDYAVSAEDCWIETIQIGEDAVNVPGRLPGGLEVGMSEKKLQRTLENQEMPYTVTEEEGQVLYVYNEAGYGHSTEVTTEDGKIIRIACENVLE